MRLLSYEETVSAISETHNMSPNTVVSQTIPLMQGCASCRNGFIQSGEIP